MPGFARLTHKALPRDADEHGVGVGGVGQSLPSKFVGSTAGESSCRVKRSARL